MEGLITIEVGLLLTGGYNQERIIVRKAHMSKKQLTAQLHNKNFYGGLHIATQYHWRDATDIFHTYTSHLRSFCNQTSRLHKSVRKWDLRIDWTPNQQNIGKETWLSYRSAKETGSMAITLPGAGYAGMETPNKDQMQHQQLQGYLPVSVGMPSNATRVEFGRTYLETGSTSILDQNQHPFSACFPSCHVYFKPGTCFPKYCGHYCLQLLTG
jgi:hypothetical protein